MPIVVCQLRDSSAWQTTRAIHTTMLSLGFIIIIIITYHIIFHLDPLGVTYGRPMLGIDIAGIKVSKYVLY
jgi:hypothetical protein